MLEIQGVKEEVLELLDEPMTKEELAEHIEQLVWHRLCFFDERLHEFDQRLADANAKVIVGNFVLPFLTGFSMACLGSLIIFWGC
jgi:hypothetical protein